MKTSFIRLGVSLCALVTGVSARADYMSIHCENTSFSVSMASPTASTSASCQAFDPSLGNLNSVSVENIVVGFTGGGGTVQNNGSSDASTNFLGDLQFTIGPAASPIVTNGRYPLSGAGWSVLPIAPGQMSSTYLPTVGASNIILFGGDYTTFSNLGTLEGTGNFDLPIAVVSRPNSYVTDVAIVDYSADVQLSSIYILYDYTPVPEPSTVAIGAGFIGICWVVRRRRGSIALDA